MKSFAIRLTSFLALSLAMSSMAHAQATRTWVSGVGDDANPCSRTAPCKTFAGAISKTAIGGEIDTLDPGGFGALTITKSITINGGDFTSGVLVSGTNGIVVSDSGSPVNVILRNLVMDGVGTGLDGIKLISTGSHLHVEKCLIRGFLGGGIHATTGFLTVQDSTITDNATGLLADATGGTASLIHSDNVSLINNTVGVQSNGGASISLANNALYNNGTPIACTGGSVATAGNNRFEISTSSINNLGSLGTSTGPAGPGCGNFKKVTVQ